MSISCRIADDSFFSQINNSINITDHALEFIVEDVLGFTNAFPEIKENKEQHSTSYPQKTQEFKLFSFKQKLDSPEYQFLKTPIYPQLVVYPYNEYLRIITPPPKIA